MKKFEFGDIVWVEEENMKAVVISQSVKTNDIDLVYYNGERRTVPREICNFYIDGGNKSIRRLTELKIL